MAGMNSQNIAVASGRECVQYARNDGTVQTAVTPARSQTTRRGSVKARWAQHQAVSRLASEPPIRWMGPTTAPASPTLSRHVRWRKVGVKYISPQPQNAERAPPVMTWKLALWLTMNLIVAGKEGPERGLPARSEPASRKSGLEARAPELTGSSGASRPPRSGSRMVTQTS